MEVEADVPDAAGGGLYVGDGSSWAPMSGASRRKERAHMLGEGRWERGQGSAVDGDKGSGDYTIVC